MTAPNRHVYAVELLTDGGVMRLKVGISRHPARRVKDLEAVFRAVSYPVSQSRALSEADARDGERAIIAQFPRDRRPNHRRSRELILAPAATVRAMVEAL